MTIQLTSSTETIPPTPLRLEVEVKAEVELENGATWPQPVYLYRVSTHISLSYFDVTCGM
ncbi:hypothetical protein BPOR_1170g00020 [Botrytis porri]|uniref:Uncharacterized protein n=1 Tax=Botrytis porri TaxID=87229 RepID=A0A4Z1KJP7_9HELO|nr:hypothetical protein BPOR_1170g00020 [Botrytis porri]